MVVWLVVSNKANAIKERGNIKKMRSIKLLSVSVSLLRPGINYVGFNETRKNEDCKVIFLIRTYVRNSVDSLNVFCCFSIKARAAGRRDLFNGDKFCFGLCGLKFTTQAPK